MIESPHGKFVYRLYKDETTRPKDEQSGPELVNLDTAIIKLGYYHDGDVARQLELAGQMETPWAIYSWTLQPLLELTGGVIK